jgi:hypothetical protein
LPLHAAHGFTRVAPRASVGWGEEPDGGRGGSWGGGGWGGGSRGGAADAGAGERSRRLSTGSGVFTRLARMSGALYAMFSSRASYSRTLGSSRAGGSHRRGGGGGDASAAYDANIPREEMEMAGLHHSRGPRSSGVGWSDPYRLGLRAAVNTAAHIRGAGGDVRLLRPKSRPGKEPRWGCTS